MDSSSTSSSILSVVADELHAIVAALVGGARYGFKIRLPHAMVMTTLFRHDLTARQKLQSVLRLAIEHATNLASFATVYKLILTTLKWISRHLLHQQHQQSSTSTSGGDESSLFRIFGRTLLSLIVDGPFVFMNPLQNDDDDNTKHHHHRQHRHRLKRAISMPVQRRVDPPAPPGHPETIYHSFVAGAVGGYLVWGRYSSVNYQIVLYLTSRVMVALYKKAVHELRIRRRIRGRNGSSDSTPTTTNNNRNNAYPLAAAIVWGLVMALFEESPQLLHPSLKTSMDEIYRYRLSRSYSSSFGSSSGADDADTRQQRHRPTFNQRQYTV